MQNAFHFVLPKKTRQPFNRTKTILIEYYIAACIGQELSTVADAFFYNAPAPRQSYGFHFIVITRRLHDLARVLFSISSGFSKSRRPVKTFIGYVLTFHALMKQMVVSGRQQYACEELLNFCKQLSPDGI